MRSRTLAVGSLTLVALAVLFVLTRSSSYSYRLDFSDAGQLVSGDLVRVGGTPAGKINAIELTGGGLAQVEISLDRSFGPLRKGTTATVRSPGLASVASRYVDISPAPSFDRPLPDNAVLGTGATKGIVDIDQVFDTLNANTREGLRRVIRGFGQWYKGKTRQANVTAVYFPPALQAYTKLFKQIGGSTTALDQFVDQTSKALGAIDARAPQLTDMINKARTTASALASDNSSLSRGLKSLPAALHNGSTAFKQLRTQALPALRNLVNAAAPTVAPLKGFLPVLDPVLTKAQPTLKLLRELFDKRGAHNDLEDALKQLPQVAKEVKSDFPRAIKALNESTPIFEFARPYIPDLVAWIDNWDGIFSTYDANGHYARSEPVFDDFTFTDNAQGGQLVQTLSKLRGRERTVSHDNTERCPGAGIPTPADGSAPFVDSGALSNAHCKPAEKVGN